VSLLRRCHCWDVFERFSETARQVIVYAQQEARVLGHSYIGTEHLLLGLLREEDGLAAQVLGSCDVGLERVRAEIVRTVGQGEEVTGGQEPFTPRMKKVLELSLHEALSLGQNHIEPEHLLLGLIRANDGLASRILNESGADAERIRAELIPLLPVADQETARSRATRHWPARRPGRELEFTVAPSAGVRRLLMAAAGRALGDGRTEFAIEDLLLTLTQNDETAQLLADLGINEQAIRKALRQRAVRTAPPEAAAES
jgi:ATP-dependent Clp protease ATP-binding subunit ClpC